MFGSELSHSENESGSNGWELSIKTSKVINQNNI